MTSKKRANSDMACCIKRLIKAVFDSQLNFTENTQASVNSIVSAHGLISQDGMHSYGQFMVQLWPVFVKDQYLSDYNYDILRLNDSFQGSSCSYAHVIMMALRWRHNGRDCVSNHQPHDCLLNLLFKVNIKAPRHWPLCGEFIGDRWFPRTNGQ